jgi:hypothetical protein
VCDYLIRYVLSILLVSKQRNILPAVKRRKADLIRHILHREHIIEGNIEVTGRRERMCKQLLDDIKKMRGYCKLTEESRDRTVCLYPT